MAYTVRSSRSRLSTNARAAAAFSEVNTACVKTHTGVCYDTHTVHVHVYDVARGLPKPQVLHRILTVWVYMYVRVFVWVHFHGYSLCAKYFFYLNSQTEHPGTVSGVRITLTFLW